jgi:phospholipid-translocating ATPase
MQSVPLYFIITYAYFTTTPRADGYSIELYEYSTVSFITSNWRPFVDDNLPQTMVFATVIAVSLCNGLNTNVWTGWVFFAVFIGIIILWIFTVCFGCSPCHPSD